MKSDERLVVVSNRLPLTLSREGDKWRAKASSGGLATAMLPILRQTGGLWIGWTGDDGSIPREERDALLTEAADGFSFVPVDFLPGVGPAFYTGYPNQTVWPLFHLFPSRMTYEHSSWADYVAGNQAFAERMAATTRKGDVIWIHDYHLMLLPGLIREGKGDAKVGFFLHIPFPSAEVFALLPHGDEVLLGLLGADLIAFHTHLHLQNFRSSVLRVLGLESTLDHVDFEGRRVALQALPIGIEPDGLGALVEHDAETGERLRQLRAMYAGRRVIVAVDRLDYTKGIPERLRVWRELLRRKPELREKAVLVQVAVPSREDIYEYQSLGSEINELVGEINGEFATPGWTPIVYLRHSVERPGLAALYALADVAWVTPLRDGMNLVAKEYCACQSDSDGVLVLSQFAGAAAEMGEALLVNPYDQQQVGAAVERALDMPFKQRARRMKALRERVLRNHVFAWAERFLDALEAAEPAGSNVPDALDRAALLPAFERARQRLIILGDEGTLTRDEEQAALSGRFPVDVRDALAALASDAANTVVVISGRRAPDLEEALGSVPNLLLAAEQGTLVRQPDGTWESLLPLADEPAWKPGVRSILEHFTDRTPGSFIEEKQHSLVWHYGRVDAEFGGWLASELTAVLDGLLAETDARAVNGRKTVEVRPLAVNKGLYAARLMAEHQDADIILAVGGDAGDEDVFEKPDADAWTVHIGSGRSRARYRLKDPAALTRLLKALVP